MTHNPRICEISQTVRLILLVTAVILVLAGCAAHQAGQHQSNTDQAAPENATLDQAQDPQPDHDISQITLTGTDEKTVITLPFDKSVELAPTYEHPSLRLEFSPAVTNLDLPDPVHDKLVNSLSLQPAGSDPDHFRSLDISLDQRVQFLISRPSESSVRVLLVPKPETTTRQADRPHDLPRLEDIQFTHDEQGTFFIKLFADSSFAYRPEPSQAGKISFSFPKLHIPQAFAKLYRLHKFQAPVRNAYLSRTTTGGKLTISSSRRVPVTIDRQGSTLILGFKAGQDLENLDQESGGKGIQISQSQPVQPSQQDQTTDQGTNLQSTLFPGMKDTYTGRKISIDLQDADVEHVLRLVGEVGGYNLILDQSVSGKISLKLDEVPWDQALDLVLLQKDLGMIKRGNILRIAPAQKLEDEQKRMIEARRAAIEARKSEEELAPLQTEYIQINYTSAAQLETQVQKFLSSRGELSQDSRTNQLIVNDTAKVIKKVKSVVRKLDRAERQVLIEARLISATDQFQRSLGIKWGGGYTYRSEYRGEDYEQGFYGTTGSTTADSATEPSGFAVNLPSSGPTTLGLGGFISKLTGSDIYTLDAQITLGESQGIAKTISSPKVVTLNNQQAEMVQGIKLATKTESESGGTTTEYTDATLKLSVKPQITPDNKLILDLDISDDSPVPGGEDIETRSTKTKLVVNNQQTIVIGGVQQLTESNSQDKVPGAADIPGLGWLFKNKSTRTEKRELLIFIHPKIL